MPEELTLTTTSFASGESIPREFTCEGTDISPPPEWNPVPATTESIVLIVDDPDAPGQTFTHWVLFSLPGGTTRLPREVDSATYFADADPTPKEGQNDFGDANYGGPCPRPVAVRIAASFGSTRWTRWATSTCWRTWTSASVLSTPALG